jgi:hypothetical protein
MEIDVFENGNVIELDLFEDYGDYLNQMEVILLMTIRDTMECEESAYLD